MRPRRTLEAGGQGCRETSRSGRELHGETLCAISRFQPARAREPDGQVRSQRVCWIGLRSAILRHLATRRRRARSNHGRIHGDLRAHGEFLSALSAGSVRPARAQLGRQSSWGRAARATVRTRGHAYRTPTRRSRWEPVSGDGGDTRGHSPRNHQPHRTRPDGCAGRGHRGKGWAAAALGSGARRIRQGNRAAAVPGQALSQAVRHLSP